MDIPIPYNLTEENIILEPGSEKFTSDSEMGWISEEFSWADEEGLERLFRSTVLLKAKYPTASLGACLHTAIVWEVG